MLAPTIFFVLGVQIVLGLFQSPLRNVQGKAFSFGGRQRRLALDGNINEGGNMPLVDLERIKYFFSDAKVTAVTGQFTEQIVSDVLVEAGFSSFPVAYDVIPRVKMELPNRLWTEQVDLVFGELDALIHGPMSSVSSLIALCPVHCINDDSLLTPAPFKILAVEVKSSIATLLSKISEVEKAAAKKSAKRQKQDGEDEVQGEQKPLPYWLLQNVAEPLHKIVFINGGQRSKNFILRGGESSNDEERKAWHMLREAKVSLFYKQSFTLEWTTDLSNAVENQGAMIEHQKVMIEHQNVEFEHQKVEFEHQKVKFEHQNVKIAELNALVQSLLDAEKEKKK
jgi:hypothetical protein